MYMHTLTFDSIVDKRTAIDWIRENISLSGDLDEALTEKRCSFLTGVELRKHQTARLLKEVSSTSYAVSEL